MTGDTSTAPGAHLAEGMRVPFTVVDEAVHALDSPREPWSIQVELGVPGHLDEARLRDALRQALDHHPMARARLVPARPDDRHHSWEITPRPDLDPLRVVDCPDETALAAARAELYGLSVPLAESPPLRLRLARHSGGELVMMSVNHAAFDGFGGLRVLHSLARAYDGRPEPPPLVDLTTARDLHAHLGAPDRSARARRAQRLADKMRDLASPPARLAPERASDEPGYGLHHLALSPERTQALAGLDAPGTLNDVLVAALTQAIAGWNEDHETPCERISVLVPVNLRPREWQQDVATNFVLESRVSTAATDRESPEATLEAVVAETDRIKAGGGAALIEALEASATLPTWAKQQLSPLLALTGNRLVDTAVLSNLGKLDDAPSFGAEAGETSEAWFSAPARMPCGLSVGVVTLAGRLHLVFRYRWSLWDAEAATAFASRYVSELGRYVGERW